MNTVLSSISSKIGAFVHPLIRATRAAQWKQKYKDFLVVFNWHQVAPDFDPFRHHRYTWTSFDKFVREVEFLTSEYKIVPLHDAIARLKAGSLKGRCAALTFDDGDISIAEHVAPFLTRRGLPATFFINTAYLDRQQSYWFPIISFLRACQDTEGRSIIPCELEEKALKLRLTDDPRFYNEVRSRIEEFGSFVPDLDSRLIPKQWLARLDGDQFSIGAHGHEHQRFSLMTKDWQKNDLSNNVKTLREFRGYRPIFAVPFGRAHDWTDETIRIAREQGLDIVLADGGINLGAKALYRRIPSDNQSLRLLLLEAMAVRRTGALANR